MYCRWFDQVNVKLFLCVLGSPSSQSPPAQEKTAGSVKEEKVSGDEQKQTKGEGSSEGGAKTSPANSLPATNEEDQAMEQDPSA